MVLGLAVSLFAGAVVADIASVSDLSPPFQTLEPTLPEIEAAAATAPSFSYKGIPYVQGKAFDRFYNIWLENTDFDKAAGQQDLAALAKEGIVLTNYWGVTHPSEPNYLSAAAGDHFGLGYNANDGDDFITLPKNVSSIADILDFGGVSWAEYQEHLPYAGFQGYNYSNQETFANDYMRKHNPLILFDNVVDSPERLSKIKNFTGFYDDLNAQALPQWSFITPNMTNDGHDTTIEVAGKWSANFLRPLLNNTYFTDRTLVVLTFDENETYTIQNKVMAILLGDIPAELKGTTDDTYYNHYSLISSVEANWGLPNLGRNDCGANVFQIIANKTGYANVAVDTTGVFANFSSDGWLANAAIPIPAPNLTCVGAGGPVLQSIVDAWGSGSSSSNSTTGSTGSTGSNSTTGSTGSSSGSSGSSNATNSTAGPSSTATESNSASALIPSLLLAGSLLLVAAF